MNRLVIFDDGGGQLSPLCDLRAAFELRTGALTTSERLVEQVGRHPEALMAPPELASLVASRHTEPVNRLPDGGAEPVLFLSGRWTRVGHELPRQVNCAWVDVQGHVAAALLDLAQAQRFIAAGGQPTDGVQIVQKPDISLLSRPWQVLEHANANLMLDLKTLAKRLRPLDGDPAPRVTVVGAHPVLVGRDAVVHPHVVFDTTAGPIAIDDGAEVRSMSVMVGPGYVGRQSTVCNHAHIRGHCIIGPVCKVGGEVNASLFQGFANKAHSGYLGNSFVGEWVNLGADTVTSNLKNTYGPVRVQLRPDADAEPTGMQYLGSIIGDHVKTAIGTRLMTGSVIHTGAMLAGSGFAPKCARRFGFYTDDGDELYQLEKFCQVARTMMGRRKIELSEAMAQRLAALHAG